MKNPADIKKDILKEVKQTEPLSACSSKLICTIGDPDHCLADLVSIIKHDTALTANILKVANSAAYGFSTTISSIEKAISLMGEEVVVNISINESAASVLHKELKGYESHAGDLWIHDLRTAIAAQKAAKLSKEPIPLSIAYTGGLLHDIGKAIMSNYLINTSPKILKAINEKIVGSFLDAELRIFNIDHAEIGFELAKNWNLPEPLLSIIRYHHKPSEAPDKFKHLVFSVHLGDVIAMMSGCGTGADDLSYVLDETYTDFIALNKDELILLMLEVESEFNKIQASLFPDEEKTL